MIQKEYNFKYSKSLLGFESLTVLITFGLAAYLFFEKESKIFAIILLLVGISNVIYYLSRITNEKIQMKINATGITLKNKFIAWNKIDEIQIEKIYSGNVSGDFITIRTKSDKQYDLEISEIDVTNKKLKKIISNYGNFIK
ncbi:hypothetical protein [Chryseobacterium sp. VAUSW3]|uniref:hypothetical protein n=1 Tax=Chryseobacterium sp. VAUSW3 TaxID=2010998 RepID=UPI000B4CB773|nr:hypothetical protein [Chryseobacterium sp. VAUSW3]OWR12785.1 hypothetical protein CDW55_12370 [Chryseobacterium sp. VAUSW3]